MKRVKRKSCKKRKLEYIREKNFYRLGGKGKGRLKIAIEMIDDVDFLKSFLDNDSSYLFYNLSRKFKMNFRVTNFDVGLCGDDLIKDLRTVEYFFKKTHL